MKLGIAVNDINTELAGYTTAHFAMEATNLGHQIWYINVSDFVYDPDENVHAHACSVPNTEHNKRFRSTATYLNALRGKTANKTRITIEDLDVLLLRNDPAEDVVKRPWARLAGINFGRLAMRHGVIVLNDPNGLALAVNKMYLQYFPEHVRPRTLISRNREDIKHFIKEQGGSAVLKPLAGSGGRNVFLIDPHEKANINQIIDAVFQEGYVIAQEYLPEAVKGDTRLFLMNGKPLQSKGHYAAIHRVRETEDGDMRSNMMAGAVARKAQINDSMLQLAETVRPKLIQDGMFFVGMDIVGDKLMEINVFSPGGIHKANKLEDVNFTKEVIHSLEHKV
ncbi:MAG: glutathione synthase, partial [Gammaproteobacteria bacterium]|nr:glutathione synthase [Gammaproteobacteria bacterium]